MPFYLAPIIGKGTKTEPFQPAGAIVPGWSAIRLGATQRAILYLPQSSLDVRLEKIADSVDEKLSSTSKIILDTRLSTDLPRRGFGESIYELMVTSDKGWSTLGPNRRGTRDLYIGGQLLHSAPSISGAATDDFNRANENPIGGNWSKNGAGHDFQVISNTLGGAGSNGDSAIYWNAATFTDNNYSQIEWSNVATSTDGGPACRMSTGAFSFYFASCWATSESFSEFNAGTYSVVATVTVGDFAATDTCRVSADGSTLHYYKNGSEVTGSPTTDTTLGTGSSVGVFLYEVACRVDNWEGGALGGTAASPNFLTFLGVGA